MAPSDWPFTPEVKTGGWQVQYESGGLGSYVIDFSDEDPTEEQITANVNLIAAAPRMYRALKRYLDGQISQPPSEEEARLSGEIYDIVNWIDNRG